MGKFVVLGASALLTLASVGGAFAQEAVATAKNEPAQAVQPPPPPPGAIARIDAPGDDADAAPQTRMGFCGPWRWVATAGPTRARTVMRA